MDGRKTSRTSLDSVETAFSDVTTEYMLGKMLLHWAFIYHANLAFAFIYHSRLAFAFIYHAHLAFGFIYHAKETCIESEAFSGLQSLEKLY